MGIVRRVEVRKQPEQGGIRMFVGLREREARSNPQVSYGESKFESSPNRAEFECLQDCGSARHQASAGIAWQISNYFYYKEKCGKEK